VAFSVTTRVYSHRHMLCYQPEIPWHDHKNWRHRSADNDFTYRDAGFLPLSGATPFRLVYGDHIIWSLSPDTYWKHHEVWRDKRAIRKEQMDVGVTLIGVLCRTEWCGLSTQDLFALSQNCSSSSTSMLFGHSFQSCCQHTIKSHLFGS